jgi:molybdopterin/thiamine biosynthesis adenylyltransferase/rhodanese-related sulfurtransferase/molybdopterin converting factor small subunit
VSAAPAASPARNTTWQRASGARPGKIEVFQMFPKQGEAGMAVKVMIPTPLRPYAGKQASIDVEAKTVGEALDALAGRFEELRRHLYGDGGRLRSFVNVYLNQEDIRNLEKEQTAVRDGDTISIVPSIAGGRGVQEESVSNGGPVPLSNEEVLRYSRHLIMPEVGMEGQLKLKQAKVLLIGSGGLGAPLALYLAAAGVGRLGLVDFDRVDFTNLQRQVLFGTADVGRPKLEAARERLTGLNPAIQIDLYETRLTSENALEILRPYDIVADGTDNFPTRYLVNDASVLLGKPNVYGSIFRFEGQVSVFGMPDGPCYRCLYPEPPPPGLVPSCAEGGVLGVLPGIVGSLQAMEVLKLIVGKGNSLAGRLLLFDALEMSFREMRLRKNRDCPLCGERQTITGLIDYEQFCGVRGEEAPAPETGVPEMTPTELHERRQRGEQIFLLDVREPHEYQICHLGGHLIPLGDLPRRVGEVDGSGTIVVHCRSGKRSADAVEFLRKAGFGRVWNLKGGILAWSDEVDPSVPKY